ncbi:MAG: aldolase/citrate lyase family protein [Candidatus Solibacter sp.]
MTHKTKLFLRSLIAVSLVALPVAAQNAPASAPARSAEKPKLYNTAKQKLLEGKQVFSFTQSTFDIPGYCEKAKHYDYTWFEMQHSTLEFKDVEAMIAACPHAGAIPFIRLPDAQEFHIQHATDLGALGIIVPTVDDVARAREAANWARYPPVAHRSSGTNKGSGIWGPAYAKTFNDNVLVVVMIESPTGVANAYDIARTDGVDVVIIGNNDMSVFSGFPQNDDRYQALVKKVYEDVKKAGKIFGQANAIYAKGHPLSSDSFFFQNGPSNDGYVPVGPGGTTVNPNAAPQGEEGPTAPAGGRGGRSGRGGKQ